MFLASINLLWLNILLNVQGGENMSKKKNQHVTPHKNGSWQVKGAGNKKATKVTKTQREACKIAKNIAKNQQSELLIHGKDGKIRNKHSYGNDPYPPKG